MKVSIATPVYNGEKFLPQAIESVLSQRGNFCKAKEIKPRFIVPFYLLGIPVYCILIKKVKYFFCKILLLKVKYVHIT
jgi:hypothetical protein